MHNCSQRRNRCTTLLKEKETDALLFSREGKRCSTVFKIRKQGHYCYQEKETGALNTTVLRIGEGNRCYTVLKRREQVQYCSQETKSGAPSCLFVYKRR